MKKRGGTHTRKAAMRSRGEGEGAGEKEATWSRKEKGRSSRSKHRPGRKIIGTAREPRRVDSRGKKKEHEVGRGLEGKACDPVHFEGGVAGWEEMGAWRAQGEYSTKKGRGDSIRSGGRRSLNEG